MLFMFNRARARIALFLAKRLYRSARKDIKTANTRIIHHANGKSSTMPFSGLKLIDSAVAKRIKANKLVHASRKLRVKARK